jgi:hypothetical protein
LTPSKIEAYRSGAKFDIPGEKAPTSHRPKTGRKSPVFSTSIKKSHQLTYDIDPNRGLEDVGKQKGDSHGIRSGDARFFFSGWHR